MTTISPSDLTMPRPWYIRPVPTPELDKILARYVGVETPDGWVDALPVTTDAAAVRFLTDFRTYCSGGDVGSETIRSGPTEADTPSASVSVEGRRSPPTPPVC